MLGFEVGFMATKNTMPQCDSEVNTKLCAPESAVAAREAWCRVVEARLAAQLLVAATGDGAVSLRALRWLALRLADDLGEAERLLRGATEE